MTLQQYAETVYFPNIKTKKSPSTVKGYVNLYNAHRFSRALAAAAFDLYDSRYSASLVPH